ALFPRVLDVMEARSAVILRGLLADPRLSVTVRSPFPAVRRALRIAVKYTVPVTVAQALLRPAAARARAERIGAEMAARLALSETATAAERLDFVERALGREVITLG